MEQIIESMLSQSVTAQAHLRGEHLNLPQQLCPRILNFLRFWKNQKLESLVELTVPHPVNEIDDNKAKLIVIYNLKVLRKVMTNLDSILKSRDFTLPIKMCLVKAMVFPVIMYGCESCSIKKSGHQRIDAFELWCWRTLLIYMCQYTVLVFFLLAYFTLYNRLQFHPPHQN